MVLGDVVISVPQAKRQAWEAGKTLKSEAAKPLVHGILHLLGYTIVRLNAKKNVCSDCRRVF